MTQNDVQGAKKCYQADQSCPGADGRRRVRKRAGVPLSGRGPDVANVLSPRASDFASLDDFWICESTSGRSAASPKSRIKSGVGAATGERVRSRSSWSARLFRLAVVGDGFAEAFFEADDGGVAEFTLGAGGIGEAVLHVSDAGGFEDGLDVDAHGLVEGGDQVEERVAFAAGEVVDLAGDIGGGRCREVAGDDIGDVGEISRLLAVAKDGRPFSGLHFHNESRDHRGIGAKWILPRSKYVEVAKADRFQTVGMVEGFAIEFAGELGGGIGRQRRDEIGLAFGQPRRVSVGSAGRGIDDASHSGLAGLIENGYGPGNARCMRCQRIAHASWHGCQSCLMKDKIDPFHGGRCNVWIANAPLDDFNQVTFCLHVFQIASRKIIQDANLVASSDKRADNMRTNEPTAASH